MDSTPRRAWARALRQAAFAFASLCALPAAALNHTNIVSPIAPGRFVVACSNVAQDASRIASGASASDYWEGRDGHYITDILANPEAALQFNARVPFQPLLYPNHAGGAVPFVAIVCHPTSSSNTDPSYVLPDTGEIIPHMQPVGAPPKLIDTNEYLFALGLPAPASPINLPARLPLIVYSHGLTGSPISQGYVQVMVALAAQGYVVAAPFHGDPRFSRVRIEDVSDLLYLIAFFPEVAEMQAMRPLSLKTMTDVLLAGPFAPGIDTDRIGGFGASLGGEAMALLLGAKLTSNAFGGCADPVHDPRIKAAVGYVPFAGWPFLNAFCDSQDGATGVNRPYLAISGTADTTAPLDTMRRAMDKFQSSRYLVELINGQHELRPEDAGDLFTWMITFLDAYLGVPGDPGAMARFIRMDSVTGGREDHMIVDVHQPFASSTVDPPALEFYNTFLGHYFVTNGAGEIDNILHGGAGPGWELTGQAFSGAFTVPPPGPPPGFAAVCRFYGTPGVGPNSHFYTSDSAECDSVKHSVGWTYEGIGFYIRAINADHSCPDGYLAVNRAYNNRAAQNDSNHRYSTSDSTMVQMQSQGWVYEGNSMCALP